MRRARISSGSTRAAQDPTQAARAAREPNYGQRTGIKHCQREISSSPNWRAQGRAKTMRSAELKTTSRPLIPSAGDEDGRWDSVPLTMHSLLTPKADHRRRRASNSRPTAAVRQCSMRSTASRRASQAASRRRAAPGLCRRASAPRRAGEDLRARARTAPITSIRSPRGPADSAAIAGVEDASARRRASASTSSSRHRRNRQRRSQNLARPRPLARSAASARC